MCCGVVAILVVAVDVCAERRQSSIAVHKAGLLIAYDTATWHHNTNPAKSTTVSRSASNKNSGGSVRNIINNEVRSS